MEKFDIAPFKFKLIPTSEVRDEWLRYKRQFEYLALANGVSNKTRLKNIFLARAGPDVQEIFCSIPGADVEERHDVDPFRVAINKLDEYFAPKQHEAYQRFLFWSLAPNEKDESLDKFLLRATELAGKCNFGRSKQEAQEISVVDKIIQLAPPELREKLLQRENLALEDVTKMVNSFEAVKFQASQMASSSQPSTSGLVNKIRNSDKGHSGHSESCSRCGRKGHYASDAFCPARSKFCDRCGKMGHFAIRCHSTNPPLKRKREAEEDRTRKRLRYQPIREIEKVEAKGTASFIFSIGDGDEFLWIAIGGVLVQVLIDSGSEKNILDDITWAKMRSQGVKVKNLRSDSDQAFRAYGRSAKLLIV